MQCEWSLDPFA